MREPLGCCRRAGLASLESGAPRILWLVPEKVKKHTHVTPRVYLRRFATDGLLIAERTGREPKPIGVPEVAVRKRFYTLKRSDGTSSNEVENSLGTLESKVIEAFVAIDRGLLPLDPQAKAVLAEFIGVQMTRGVRYREMRSDHIKQNEDWLRGHVRELFLKHAPSDRASEADDYARNYDLSRLETQENMVQAGIGTGIILTNALVNMCWTMVAFDRPLLLGSDQPAVCWYAPHRAGPWAPSQAVEIRVPLSPTQALVASWHDEDDRSHVLHGQALAGLSMNHYTAKQAADWVYWLPGTTPRRGQPVHDEPITGSPPATSRRRELTTELTERLLESREETITVFTPARVGSRESPLLY